MTPDLARSVETAVAEHGRQLVTWSRHLRHDVEDVALYVAEGGEFSPEQVDRLLVAYLGSAAGRPETGIAWWSAEAASPLEALVLAAYCRHWATEGEPVSQAQLAALTGLTLQTVRDKVSAGELRADVRTEEHGRVRLVAAAEARRWLASRGVAGFA